jgi:hypothetical protein
MTDPKDTRQTIWSRLVAAVRSLTGRKPAAHGPLTEWTDAEVYRVWCATGAELLKALEAEQTDHTVTAAEAREHLLAEIERRYPQATATWLASDAILSGQPPHFLRPNN